MSQKKNSNRLLITIVILIVLGAFGAYSYVNRPAPANADYKEATVGRGTIEINVLATGVVQPFNRLEIKPAIAGRADHVLVREGDYVKQGQTLVWMSSTERAALLDAARARGPEEMKKWEDLYRSAPIVAPISGTIIAKNLEDGQTFAVTDPILVMSDKLTIQAQVDETDIGEIHVGQKATLVLDAYPNDLITGHVDRIAFEGKTVSNVTTYIAYIVVDKMPPFMRSGMTANVSFHISTRPNVINIPAEAVKVRGQEKIVIMPTQDPKQNTERPIETGISDGKRVEITKGLEEGDKILVPKVTSFLRAKNQVLSPMNPTGNSTPRPKRTPRDQ